MLTRRCFLDRGLRLSAGIAVTSAARSLAASESAIELHLAESALLPLSDDFTGLGYEMSSVATPGLLSPANHRYVELVRGLGWKGTLRFGGAVSGYTRFEPSGTIMADRQNTVVTRACIEQLARFLTKTEWKAIWSVNFAQGTIAEAAQEAKSVANALGPQLLAIEIGNEVEDLDRGPAPFRHSPYTYEMYRKEYNKWHSAIAKEVPHLGFAAPDTKCFVDWPEQMAKDAQKDVQLLAAHYYRNNQRLGSLEQLTYPDPRLKERLGLLRDSSTQSHIPWRMCEANSFSGGGRPGVSDSFIAALWTLDFMLLLASYGCSGVNIETGINQLGFISSYSPIQDDGAGTNSAGVPYYGMLAFAVARELCSTIIPVTFDPQGINFTAYLLGKGRDACSLVAINRDPLRDIRFSIGHLGLDNLTVLRLSAPAPDARSGVTFGGSPVGPEGRWNAVDNERVRCGRLFVPRMSAAVVCRAISPKKRMANALPESDTPYIAQG